MIREVTGEMVRIGRLEERLGEEGRKIVIVELEKEEDQERVLRMRAELWRR